MGLAGRGIVGCSFIKHVKMRKGVPAHLQIVQNYLRGIAFGDKDVVVWVDILPNRQESEA